MKATQIFLCGLFAAVLGLTSCSSDNNLEQKDPNVEYVNEAKNILNGDIVLSTKATMNGVDKTLSLKGFTVGNMPLIVYFSCKCKFMQLNSWEKDEYKGEGWVKFKGKDGNVTGDPKDNSGVQKGSGAGVDGYLNVKTKEIIFIVNYNMMNVRSECFLQTTDRNRINNYAAEFAQYEKDLAAYKKEHGL